IVAGGNGHRMGEHWGTSLTGRVVTPADDRAVGTQGERVVIAGGDGYDVGEPAGDIGLPETVIAPNYNRAVGEEGHAVQVSSAKGGDTGQSAGQAARGGGLAKGVEAPGEQTSVDAQSEVVVAACRYGAITPSLQFAASSSLTERVVAPAEDGARRQQSQAVRVAGSHTDRGNDVRWHGCLTAVIAAPGHDMPVLGNRQVMRGSRGDADKAVAWDVGLAVGVAAPRHQHSIAPQGEAVEVTAGDRDHVPERGGWAGLAA